MDQTQPPQLTGDQPKQIWKALFFLGWGVVTTLSTAVAFVYKQKSDNDAATILYERSQKEYYQKGWERCQDDRIRENQEAIDFRRESKRVQDTVKAVYKIK